MSEQQEQIHKYLKFTNYIFDKGKCCHDMCTVAIKMPSIYSIWLYNILYNSTNKIFFYYDETQVFRLFVSSYK